MQLVVDIRKGEVMSDHWSAYASQKVPTAGQRLQAPTSRPMMSEKDEMRG